MASKRRQRRRLCERKQKYQTRQEAVQKAVMLRKRNTKAGDGHPIDAFKCSLCGYFHVGHRPKNVQQSLQNRRNNEGA